MAATHQRHQHVVAGERHAEKTPRRLIAADHPRPVDLIEQAAAGGKIRRRARAILRTRPPMPFDAGVIRAEAGVPKHRRGDGEQRQHQHLMRRADRDAEQDHGGQRHRDVIGVALLQAERARRIIQRVLKEEEARHGREAERDDRDGGCGRWFGTGKIERSCGHRGSCRRRCRIAFCRKSVDPKSRERGPSRRDWHSCRHAL